MALIIIRTVLIFAVFAAIMSTSNADARSDKSTGKVHVNGTLYCCANGAKSGCNGNTPQFFPNATVQVKCRPGVIEKSPSNTTTDASGTYLVVLIPSSNATVSSIVSGCQVVVLTRLSSCNRALPSARLVSGRRFVKVVEDGLNYITYMVASGFSARAN